MAEYVWIRGLTWLRSGEDNGLRWDCVDLERRLIDVRRTRCDGRDGLPKTTSSHRLIPMCSAAADAFDRQWERTGKQASYVFLSRRGQGLDAQSFGRRDWRRTLDAAGLP